MKKFILGLVAASVAATPVMAAAAPQPQRHTEVQRTVVKQRPNGTTVVKQRTVQQRNTIQQQRYVQQRTAYRAPQYRSWHRGERFDNRYARNYRQIDYRQYRGLRAPPRGYRYVQSGNDAVLVGITSGIISAVFANLIR
ncbi:RcnB family protein [Sphingomonas xinjiangensis]|uniref:Ni/Co efflux regulator RcnB n=1 Tax=Sphingomonas xinjiangensis TaxID=643568 RepID=A0A840YQ71_9SPHN|nr:RcnB family protein [Sphingomonas xinjiangensis]MBB5710871.1 Ni/Co efflux regulator RcnB [Sphingomonas xinjiangensis]